MYKVGIGRKYRPMQKRQLILSTLIILSLLLFGCAQTPTEPVKQSQKIKLYFADANNENFSIEERQISYKDEEEKLRVTLEQLIKGPEDKAVRNNIQENTKVYGTMKQKTDVIVNLSQDFNQFGGSVAEILAVGAIVNTMTQFEEIKRVKILIEGEELMGPSGQPRGFMEPFIKEPNANTSIKTMLYFANNNATLVKGESRTISVPQNAENQDVVRIVLEELIKGPYEAQLHKTIPSEVKVLSVEIKDKTATIDFSEEMDTKHWGGAAGEAMTLHSIVNTLTEFNYIQQVMMTIEGKAMK